MSRPPCCRRVAQRPRHRRFGPTGTATDATDELVLSMDEFEALRLADVEGLYQETAATRMDVSRPTFGRILAAARHTVARALVEGTSLRIEGGHISVDPADRFECRDCHHHWTRPSGTNRPGRCPACAGRNTLEPDPASPSPAGTRRHWPHGCHRRPREE